MQKVIIFFLLILFIISGCENRQSKQTEEQMPPPETAEKAADIPGLTIESAGVSSEYPDAILEMHTPGQYEQLSSGPVEFAYDVKNFEYAREGDGAFLTVNLNNQFISAHNQPSFTLELDNDNYAALTFLTLPNGVSLKHYGAYVFRQIQVGASQSRVGEETPMLFFNQPRGRFKADQEVPLDFYIVNAELTPNGMRVKAELGNQVFLLDEWRAWKIKNLPKGEHSIRLSLVDDNDNLVESPFSSVTRSFTVR